MSNIGICEYCKYKDKDMTQNPCCGCSAQMGAFNFDMTEHDNQIRAEVIDEIIQLVNSDGFKMRCLMSKLPFYEFVEKELKRLKEQKDE